MSEITTIGLDLAKHVFQVHGIDAQGTTVLRKRLRRGQVLAFFSRIPRCVVGLALRVSRPAQIQRSGLLPQVA
jgi:transposase